MPAQIRPNRLEVNDRFPMLGFTIRTHGEPRRAEVAVATSPMLLTPAGKPRRSQSNFYSSRAGGPLTAPRGEAVFVLPPDVLARFVGSEKLYFGLATAPATGPTNFEIEMMPTEASPYVSLRALTGRSLRRVRVPPGRPRNSNGVLEWAGDTAQPGSQPASRAGAAPAPVNGTPASGVHYDDGFGPMQSPKPATPPSPPAPTSGTSTAAPPVQPPAAPAQSYAAALDDDDGPGIEGPVGGDDDTATAAQQAFAGAFNASPDYSGASRFVAATGFRASTGQRTINRVVIHVTDGPSTSSAVNTFSAAGAQASAHYIVGQDGEVVQMVRENDVAWHAHGANSDSIGIEHVAIKRGGVDYPRRNGTMQHFNEMPPSDAQYCASAALVSYLCDKYAIAVDRQHILGHAEADPHTAHASCPNGAGWNWTHYMHLVTDRVCEAQPAVSAQGLAYAERRRGSGRTLAVVDPVYTPSDAGQAAAAMAAFNRRREAWRVGVADTRFMPHSAICSIERPKTDGSWEAHGTGFYVAPDLILTAAHVVDGRSRLRICAGRNGSTWLSDFTVGPDDWSMHPDYDQTRNFDMAVIRVTTPPPLGQFFSLEEMNVSTADPIIVCGYAAAGVDPTRQHLDADSVQELSDNGEIMRYNLQTTGGTSGAPVFYITGYEDEARQASVVDIRVIAVHVAAATPKLNQACRLTAAKIAWISGRGLVSVAAGLAQSADATAAVCERARRIGGAFSARMEQALGRGLAADTAHRLLNLLDAAVKPRAAASGLAVVDMDYAPSDPDAAAVAIADFNRRQASWRAGVPQVNFFPHSAICHLETEAGAATGFYIAPDLVATAAHVLWGASQVTVRPGRAGDTNLGSLTVRADAWATHPSYSGGAHDFDIAVIRVSLPPPAGVFFTLEELDISPAAPMVVCGYAAEGVDPTRQHLDADRVRELSDNGEILRYNLQTTGGTSGAPVFYMHGAEDEARRMSIGDLRVVAVHVDRDTATLNQACRLTRAKIAWLSAGGTVSVGQALQYAGARARAVDPRRSAPAASWSVAAHGLALPSAQRRSETTDRDGVRFELEQMDGMRAPRTQKQTITTMQSGTIALEDWPRMPDDHGGSFGTVRIGWSYADGAVGDVRVMPIGAGLSDGWSLRVTGCIADGPDAETTAAVTIEIRHAFTKAGEPDHRSLICVVLHGDGKHERSNEWERDSTLISA